MHLGPELEWVGGGSDGSKRKEKLSSWRRRLLANELVLPTLLFLASRSKAVE
jgi:hypothetical protein